MAKTKTAKGDANVTPQESASNALVSQETLAFVIESSP